MTQDEIDKLADRFTDLFGSARWKTALAEALEIDRAHLNNMFSPSRPNIKPAGFLIVVCEMLERMPVSRWPERFHALAIMRKRADKIKRA